MNRYICIHGHFYQPPRENPWLEEIETQDTAYPYHDWNERITAECYAKNASSRILGTDKTIIDIVNNYAKISFNFGPTLLSWMERNDPGVYEAILAADRESLKQFSGHGSAIAQVYNHIIMPLASDHDKKTEVIWGIRDFERRFLREPEGMWLPETAVCQKTLSILAENNIRYTILAPHQARRIRKNNESWIPVFEGTLDTTVPYLCRLPDDKTIAIFFYDAKIAYETAFGDLLKNGERFASRMMAAFLHRDQSPRLVSIATDGETYGHHHRFADMALAYAIHTIESGGYADITNYGEFLSRFPPVHEVEIVENSSWSCSHGIQRWRQDCGCHTDHVCLITDKEICTSMDPMAGKTSHTMTNWNQKWRIPLREAMDWLSEQLKEIYETSAKEILKNPLQARDDYIEVISDRQSPVIDQFLQKHVTDPKNLNLKLLALELLEMQRNALLMFTSCGWFFDDISGIETIQVMRYACRAIELAEKVSSIDLEPGYLHILNNAQSNMKEFGDGSYLYKTYVKSAAISVSRAAFHYAIMSLFESDPDKTEIPAYIITRNTYKQATEGKMKLITGNASFRSLITREETLISFAAIHIETHNFIGGIRPYTTEVEHTAMQTDIWNAFLKNDLLGIILALNVHFESHSYSLGHLFPEGKRRVMSQILKTTMSDIEDTYREIYDEYFSLIKAMKEMNIKPPEVLESSIQYILNRDLHKNLKRDEIDLLALKNIIDALLNGHFKPDILILQFELANTVTRYMAKIQREPDDIKNLITLNQLLSLIEPLHLKPDIWNSQNQYYRIGMRKQDEMRSHAATGDTNAMEWLVQFTALGQNLGVSLSS